MTNAADAVQPASLAAALVAFQAIVPVIAKNKTAVVPMRSGGKYTYKYADLADILAAIRQPLAQCGLAVTQGLTSASQGKVGIKTTVWHARGDTYAETVEFSVSDKPQEIGSAISYFKRYALSATLAISTDEDDDGALSSSAEFGREQPTPRQQPKQPTELELATDRAQKAVKACGATLQSAVAWAQENLNADLRTTTDIALLAKVAEHYEALAALAAAGVGATEAT